MQKNLGYVIPSIVIPDTTTNIGYWYLGSVPLGVRATGTMWTIGSDHYWYCDNVKTDYLAEIPVEEYNREFQEMLNGYADDWTEWFTAKQSEWTTFYNTSGAQFTAWFNRMKGQLSTDAAGNLQLEIDALVESFTENIEDYDISSDNYTAGTVLMYKNRLSRAKVNITAGDSFIVDDSDPNQNLEYISVSDVLSSGDYWYNTWADAEADIANIEEGGKVYTNDDPDDVINARNVRYDDGTQAGSDVETQIKALYQMIEDIGGSSMKSKIAFSGAFSNTTLTINLSSIGVTVDSADDYYILLDHRGYDFEISNITKSSTEFTITRASASSTPNIVIQIVYSPT